MIETIGAHRYSLEAAINNALDQVKEYIPLERIKIDSWSYKRLENGMLVVSMCVSLKD